MRYTTTFKKTGGASLEEYVSNMKEGQEKIYFLVMPNIDQGFHSPYMEPFKGTNIPIIILNNNVDEICFQQIQSFKGKKFVNIETSYENIAKDLGKKEEVKSELPEDDVSGFCLWLKNALGKPVSKVTLSKRLTDTPAVLVGQTSSSMRMVMQMMESMQSGSGVGGGDSGGNDQTLEINATHPIIVHLNELRKDHSDKAEQIAKHMLENVMLVSGIPYDI